MFTQRCFIRKSTKSLTDRLYRLGNRSGRRFWHIDYLTILAAYGDYFTCLDDERRNDKFLINCGFVDCGTNEELFLSIAALRDDSDKFQYFTNGVFWIKCSQLELKHELDNNYEEFCVADFHKATVQELIEHFKP